MKRPIKVYLSAHSEDLASASRVASLVLDELGCEVVTDYTPVEKAKECRANRRRHLQRCQVFLQLVGRGAGPILAPEHQHDSLCSVAVWEAGEASALHKPVIRLLLADDFPFDEPECRSDNEEASRFQQVHRHRLMKHQRNVLSVEDHEELVQRIGQIWCGSFARKHSLPELGLQSESIESICARICERLFGKEAVAEASPAPAVHHEPEPPAAPEAPASLPKPGSPAVSTTTLAQIVTRPATSIVPRVHPRSEGQVMTVNKFPESGDAGGTPPGAPAVDPPHPETAEPRPPGGAAVSQREATPAGNSKAPPAAKQPPPSQEESSVRRIPQSGHNHMSPSSSAVAPVAAGNPRTALPILGLSVPAMAIAVSRHAFFLSLLNRSPAGQLPVPLADGSPGEQSVARQGRMPEALAQAQMKLEFSRPKLHGTAAVAGSAPQQWRVPFRRGQESARAKAGFDGAEDASGSLMSVDSLPALAHSIVSTLKFPGDILRNGLPVEARGVSGGGFALKRNRPLFTRQIRVTLALVGGLFAWAVGLLLHAGWHYITKPRATAESRSQAAASVAQNPPQAVPAAQGGTEEKAEPSPRANPAVPGSSDQKLPLTGKAGKATASMAPPPPADALVESQAPALMTLEEEQEMLECQLEAAIVAMREKSGDAKACAQAQEALLRDILPRFQELAPRVTTRTSPRSPQALAMSRHVASIHLLCNHIQAARNALLDMREHLAQTRPPSDAEVRLTDYLLELSEGDRAGSGSRNAMRPFPMTPGETRILLEVLRSRPEWMPADSRAAIAGSDVQGK